MPYFRNPEIQAELTNILYLFSTSNPNIGYRQGMHELLASIYQVVDYDSLLESDNVPSILSEFCSRTWVAADSWLLFHHIMQAASKWYEWQEPKESAPVITSSRAQGPGSGGPLALKPYVAPISEACARIQGTLLKSVDPALWRAMQNAGIEPQIYGM